MNMTFVKLSAAVCLAFAMRAASADYLYWMVESANDGSGPVSFDYARLSVDGGQYCTFYVLSGDDAVPLNGYGGDSTKLQSDPSDSTSSIGGVGVYADITDIDPDATTFLFELLSESKGIVGEKLYRYDALSSYIVRTADIMSQSADEPFLLSFVVPEPTSGLLVLFGIAGLALRRRKIQ